MTIEIVKKGIIHFQKRFDILVDGNLAYKAKRVFCSVPAKTRLLDLANHEICSIQRQDLLISSLSNYDFVFENESVVRLIFDSYTHFKLYVPKGIIDIYVQKDRKLGFFLNGLQVGVMEKNKIEKFGGYVHKILIDSAEIVKELAIAFTLAYDNYRGYNGAILNIDFGYIFIKTAKEIDPNWKPKN